jgi:hypothetical protein
MKFTAALVALVITTAASAKPETRTRWYVRAGAGGDGTRVDRPAGTLAQLERLSAPRDLLFVLVGDTPLDGGITLKLGQLLTGVVTKRGASRSSSTAALPVPAALASSWPMPAKYRTCELRPALPAAFTAATSRSGEEPVLGIIAVLFAFGAEVVGHGFNAIWSLLCLQPIGTQAYALVKG